MDVEDQLIQLIRISGANHENIENLKLNIENLKDRIDFGDNNVRHGLESLKEVIIDVQASLRHLSDSTLGPADRKAIDSSFEQMERDMAQLEEVINTIGTSQLKHFSEHDIAAGRKDAMTQLKENWVQPVVTAVLIGVLMLFITQVVG